MRARGRAAVALAAALLAPAPATAVAAGHAAHPRSHRPARRRPTRALPGAPVPAGFVGMNENGPLFQSGDGLSLAEQFAAMADSGVQSVRVAFSWADAQPYASWSQVPAGVASQFVDVGGVPTDFAETDQVMALAALYGLRVLPVVLYSPGWDAEPNPGGLSPPADPEPYAAYLSALIARYGPGGSYWITGQPSLPVRQWQIWNEPNLGYYWPQPSTVGYLQLLSAAHAAIVRADPGAQTVLGALTNLSWQYLAQIYATRGARSLFDVVAVNPFTATAAGVLRILGYVRATMSAHGDVRRSLIVTELGWTSAGGLPCAHFDWDTTEAGQARRIAAALPLLAAHRRGLRLAAVYYYTWIGNESECGNDWDFAGLFRDESGQAVAKPAYAAFVRAVHALEAR